RKLPKLHDTFGNGVVPVPKPLTAENNVVLYVVYLDIVLTGGAFFLELLDFPYTPIIVPIEMNPVKSLVGMGRPNDVGVFKTKVLYGEIKSLDLVNGPFPILPLHEPQNTVVGTLDIGGVPVRNLDG